MARRFVSASGRYFATSGGRYFSGVATLTYATTFAVALSAASGTVGTQVIATYTPVGGAWPVAIGTATTTLSGSFASSVLSPAIGTTTPVTATLTSSAAAVGSIGATFAGMTGSSATYTATASGSGSAPATLSGLTWNQPNPLTTNVSAYTVIGWLTPTNGIGPYRFSTASTNFQLNQKNGEVTVYFNSSLSEVPSSNVFTVTDARGATASVTATIATTNTTGLVTNWRTPVPNGDSQPYSDIFPGMNAPGQTFTVTDRSTGAAPALWSFQYNALRWAAGDGHKVTAGTYLFHLVDGGGQAKDFNYIVQAFTPCAYIEVSDATVNTQSLAGAHAGWTRATTANNAPSFAITDPGGYFAINSGTGERTLAKQIPTAGAYPYTVTVTDGFDSYTQSFSLTAITGVLLDSSHMTFGNCTLAFTNDTRSNVVGIPTVTGLTGTPTWSLLSQTGLSEAAVGNGVPARFLQDQGTGNITVPGLLSADLDGVSSYTDTLQLLVTDGTNTCINTLGIVTSWAAVSKTLHVGRGKSTASGLSGTNPSGYETLASAKYQCMGNHSGTYNVLIYADTDPNYYTNDNGPATPALRFDWVGPIHITGVAANGFSQPRIGGPTADNVAAGQDYEGKGFIVSGDGDMVLQNVEGSGCHDGYGDGAHGVEFVRKDGAVMGNLSVLNCYLHDNDTNVLTAFGHQRWLIQNSVLSSGGTSYVGSGATHNAYLGEGYEAIVNQCVSRRATNGHLIKSRCKITRVTNSRIYDGIGGSASACIELPSGGEAHVLNNIIEKGTMPQGPDAIRYGYEGCQWVTNSLQVSGNTVSLVGVGGNHFGGPAVVGWDYGANAAGVAATCTIDSNSVFLGPNGVVFRSDGSSNTTVTPTNTTTLAIPAAIDGTRPDLAGSLPLPVAGVLYRGVGVDTYANYGQNLQQLGTKDQYRVASSAAVGTVIDTVSASNDLGQQGGGTASPFGAGTTWQVITANTYYASSPNPFDATNFAVTANSNGTAAVKTAASLTANTVHYLQLRATATSGAVCDMRYPIVVTA